MTSTLLFLLLASTNALHVGPPAARTAVQARGQLARGHSTPRMGLEVPKDLQAIGRLLRGERHTDSASHSPNWSTMRLTDRSVCMHYICVRYR